jgi:hypothetical protein
MAREQPSCLLDLIFDAEQQWLSLPTCTVPFPGNSRSSSLYSRYTSCWDTRLVGCCSHILPICLIHFHSEHYIKVPHLL